MINIKFFAILLILIHVKHSESDNDKNHMIIDQQIKDNWDKLLNKTKDWINFSLKDYDYKLILNKNNHNVSEKCKNAIITTFESAKQFELWALSMLNSWGQIPSSGFLSGTFTDLGAYDQCIEINNYQINNDLIGQGQYCLIDFRPYLPKLKFTQNLFHKVNVLNQNNQQSIAAQYIANHSQFSYFLPWRVGICLPSTCSQFEVYSLTTIIADEWGIVNEKVRCEIKQKVTLNTIQITAIVVGLSIITIVIISTLIDTTSLRSLHKKSFPLIINCFSLKQNLHTLLTTKTSTSDLRCIHGLRTLTLAWIIMGHTILWGNFQIYNNSFASEQLLTAIDIQPFLNATYSVDTFFAISGVLTSYVCWSLTNGDKKKFSKLAFIILRYIRLAPQIGFFILFTYLLPLTNSGPLWNQVVGTVVNRCYDNWWISLLFIQNFYKINEMCALHTWWLAVEYQLHMFALIVILSLFKFGEKIGHLTNIFVILINIILSSFIIYKENIPPAMINTQRNINFETNANAVHFWKPYPHAPVFFIGFIIGYLLQTKKIPKLSKVKASLIWLSIFITFMLIFYDSYPWLHGQEYNKITSIILFNLTRTLWGVCISLIVLLCATNNGLIFNQILSFKFFIPLSRLSYSVYLTHAWSIWTFIGTTRYGIDTSRYAMIFTFFSHWIWSYLFGTLFMLIIESPIIQLLKLLLNKIGLTQTSQINNKNININNNKNNNNNDNVELIMLKLDNNNHTDL